MNLRKFGIIFLLLINISCKENVVNDKDVSEKTNQTDFLWLKISENDSVKFKGFSTRFFNQGKDSIVFAHYISKLYKSKQDVENPEFKKQSLLVINELANKNKLPDSMFIQAMGIKTGTIVKKSSDFNILCAFNGTEWIINDNDEWKSMKDFDD